MGRDEKIKLLLAIKEGKVSKGELLGKVEIRVWEQTENFNETGLWEWNGKKCQESEISSLPKPLGGVLNILALRSPVPILINPNLTDADNEKDMERYEGPYNYWPPIKPIP